jgi:hypothetical protein
MMKWIAAGLAGMNGLGAIKAVSLNMTHQHERVATILFIAGVIVAFGSAVFVDHAVKRVEHPDLELGNYWAHADFTGERNEQREAELQLQMQRAGRILIVPPLILALSAALFVAGIILLKAS